MATATDNVMVTAQTHLNSFDFCVVVCDVVQSIAQFTNYLHLGVAPETFETYLFFLFFLFWHEISRYSFLRFITLKCARDIKPFDYSRIPKYFVRRRRGKVEENKRQVGMNGGRICAFLAFTASYGWAGFIGLIRDCINLYWTKHRLLFDVWILKI